MKDEINIRHCKTYEDVVKVISEWADYYNTDRYQWNLARLSPNEFYEYCLTGVYPLTIPPAKGCGSDEEYRRGLCPRPPEVYRFGFQEDMHHDGTFCAKKDSVAAVLPPTRQGAQVAPQRCLILPAGKAILL